MSGSGVECRRLVMGKGGPNGSRWWRVQQYVPRHRSANTVCWTMVAMAGVMEMTTRGTTQSTRTPSAVRGRRGPAGTEQRRPARVGPLPLAASPLLTHSPLPLALAGRRAAPSSVVHLPALPVKPASLRSRMSSARAKCNMPCAAWSRSAAGYAGGASSRAPPQMAPGVQEATGRLAV